MPKVFKTFACFTSLLIFSFYFSGAAYSQTATGIVSKRVKTSVDNPSSDVKDTADDSDSNDGLAPVRTRNLSGVKTDEDAVKNVPGQTKNKFSKVEDAYKTAVENGKRNKSLKLEVAQQRRFNAVLQRGAHVQARFEVIIERFRYVISIIDSHLAQQKSSGFDVSDKEKKLDLIRSDVDGLSTSVADFGNQYKEMANAQDVETVRTELKSLKQSTRNMVTEAKKIRKEVISLVKEMR